MRDSISFFSHMIAVQFERGKARLIENCEWTCAIKAVASLSPLVTLFLASAQRLGGVSSVEIDARIPHETPRCGNRRSRSRPSKIEKSAILLQMFTFAPLFFAQIYSKFAAYIFDCSVTLYVEAVVFGKVSAGSAVTCFTDF